MLRTLNCPVIALEEHYWDKELAALFVGVTPGIVMNVQSAGQSFRRLFANRLCRRRRSNGCSPTRGRKHSQHVLPASGFD